MGRYCFGVDLGGTTAKIGLFETSGNLIKKYEIPTRKEENGKYILSDIASSLKDTISQMNIDKKDIDGIGIGVPGPVIAQQTVNRCANLGWGVTNVAQELEALTQLPVKVGNDANVAALGEYWKGEAAGCESMVMITLGTGVGGGIIINGKPLEGRSGSAGEIGHMPVVYDETDTCGCGKKGCLEQAASASGIVKTAKRLLVADDRSSSLRNIKEITAKDIFDCAKEKDALALEVIEKFGWYLGTAMADIAAVADPEVFVIGGGVSKAGKIIIDTVEKVYKEKAFHACRDAKIVLASLGNDAGMYGCAKLVIK